MKYYTLRYPLEHNRNTYGKRSVQLKSLTFPDDIHNRFPDEEEICNVVAYLERDAPITDIITPFISNGFIVSDNFKNILEKCNLPPCRFYPITLCRLKKRYENYWYLHIVWDYTEEVDYNKSLFGLYKLNKANYHYEIVEHLIFNSKQELDDKWFELRQEQPMRYHLRDDSICFKEGFNLDLFKVPIDFYISKNLHQIIQNENITGAKFLENTIIY